MNKSIIIFVCIFIIILLVLFVGYSYQNKDNYQNLEKINDTCKFGCTESCKCLLFSNEIIQRVEEKCDMTYENLTIPLNYPRDFDETDYIKACCSKDYPNLLVEKVILTPKNEYTPEDCLSDNKYRDQLGNIVGCACTTI